ncbi:MAG: 4-hydroxy-tetrahydrodipicolinate reductase [Thermomicrobiales bacterium]|nr:4-hydroxy-tetrahydrodipicolinate reductase [Thermomicrobiales bacterium]
MIRLGIGGVQGRMGQAICASVASVEGIVVTGGVVREAIAAHAGDVLISDDPAELVGTIDVLVDVSTPDGVLRNLVAMRQASVPYVCGVTGLSDEHQDALMAAAVDIPVLLAPNFSVGVAAVTRILELAATLLADADVEIVETHHRRKQDAPSGTALLFADAIERARCAAAQRVHGREGVGPRQLGEMGIHSVRGGGNSGEHRILFAMDGEEVAIEHRALARSTFADGAVHAARWIAGKPPGRYTMQDVIELTVPEM